MEEDKEDKKHFNMREIIKNSETTKKRRKNKLKKKMLEKMEQKKNTVDDFKVRVIKEIVVNIAWFFPCILFYEDLKGRVYECCASVCVCVSGL